MNNSDDARLVERALAGDRNAFGILVERYAAQARRVARALLRNADDADDAAQDAFLAALAGLARYDARRPFGPWLLRIVSNTATDRSRRRAVRRADPLDENMIDGAETPERAAARGEVSIRLRDALSELPERQRLAVVLYDAEGYSHAEIAGILGVPVGTVRSDVHHARRSLRARLAEWKESIE
jgi:RNA polymerase sigma-70 factor (ECF subfamily)